MAKIITTLIAMTLAMLTSFQAVAYYFSKDGINYNILSEENLTVEVVASPRYEPYSGDVKIPPRVSFDSKVYKVICISNHAFYGCSGLTSVTIPNSVTSIGDRTFYRCSGLTSVTIPNSVTSIGDGTFWECGALTSVTIPNSVTSIGAGPFVGCDKLESIKVESGNPVYTSIVGILFRKDTESNAPIELIQCPGTRTSVDIPNSVTSIKGYAFRGCGALTNVDIPNSVTSIGNEAFYECSGLTSVTIPNSMTSIGDYAFDECSGLTSVDIPNSVTSIGEWAFCRCSGLTRVTIPNSVTSIGDGTFWGCRALTSVTIPNSVTSIGYASFVECSRLTSVDIPNSVTSIGWAAFGECSGLMSVTIPNSVTSIKGYAFSECYSLPRVTIPNSVTSIGDYAFEGCYGLKAIYMQREVPLECNPGFSNSNYEYATLYVPEGSIEYYKNVDPWRYFLNIEDKEYSGIEDVALELSVSHGTLTVGGVDGDEPVFVYDMHGRLVYSGVERTITNLASGLYVVKVGNQTAKCSL